MTEPGRENPGSLAQAGLDAVDGCLREFFRLIDAALQFTDAAAAYARVLLDEYD